MKLNISYIEMSFIRKILNKMQYKLSCDISGQTYIDALKLIEVRFMDGIEKEENIINPTSELGCCNIILWKIAKIEKELNCSIKSK